MNEIHAQLFDLVRHALDNIVYDKVLTEEEKLYVIARENGVSGLIYTILDKDKIGPKTYTRFQKDYYRFQTKDIIQQETISEISSICNEAEIKHIFLKGAYLKRIYPQSYMRAMGDIDMLVQKKDQEKIHQLMIEHNFKNPINSASHECFTKGKNVFIEIHPQIDLHFAQAHKDVLNQVWEEASCVSGFEYYLSIEHNLLYLLSHLSKHLQSSGIGLKQILDIGILLNKYEIEIDEKKMKGLLDNTGLELFMQNMAWLNKRYFNFISGDMFLVNFHEDESFYNELTSFILASGIHGKADDFNRAIPAITKVSLKNDTVKKSKMKYLFSVLFLKYEDMAPTRPYLQKCPVLLPFAWVARWFKLVFMQTRRSITKIKALKVNQDVLNKQLDLYKRLGLTEK